MFYIKLINGEKLQTDEINFNNWLYNSGDDFIVCWGDSGTPLYIKKNRILLGYELPEKQAEI